MRIKSVDEIFDSEMNLIGFRYVIVNGTIVSELNYHQFQSPYFVFSQDKTPQMLFDYLDQEKALVLSQYKATITEP